MKNSNISQWYDEQAATQYDAYKNRWNKAVDKKILELISDSNTEFVFLDIACGTGIQLALIEDHIKGMLPHLKRNSISLIGIDLSSAMINEAKKKTDSSRFIRGDATRIPLRTSCVDYICLQAALHLFEDEDRNGFMSEAYRVLKPGGLFEITTYDPWKMSKHWIYAVFPSTWEFDKNRFDPIHKLFQTLETFGFAGIRSSEKEILKRVSIEEALILTENPKSTSQFICLETDEWEKGKKQLETLKYGQFSELWWHEIEVKVYGSKMVTD